MFPAPCIPRKAVSVSNGFSITSPLIEYPDRLRASLRNDIGRPFRSKDSVAKDSLPRRSPQSDLSENDLELKQELLKASLRDDLSERFSRFESLEAPFSD